MRFHMHIKQPGHPIECEISYANLFILGLGLAQYQQLGSEHKFC